MNHTMLRKEQGLEVGAMQYDNDDVEAVQLSALHIEASLPEAKARIQVKAMLNNNYQDICKQIANQGNVDKGYEFKATLLC